MDFKNLVVTSWKNTLNHLGPILLVTFVQMILIVISLGILAPVTTAGYIQSFLRTIREQRPPEIRDLFSEMRLFLPLFGFSLLAFMAVLIGFSLLFLPGIALVCLLVFGAFYMIPLMTDQDFGLIEALKESWRIATSDPITDHLVVTILYIAIMSLSGSLPFLFLLAQPVATFILAEAYLERGISILPPPPPPRTETTGPE